MMIATPNGSGRTKRISSSESNYKHSTPSSLSSSATARRRRRSHRLSSSSSKKPVLSDSDPNQNAAASSSTEPTCSAVSRIKGKHSLRSMLNDLQSPKHKKLKREKKQHKLKQAQKKAKLMMATHDDQGSTPMAMDTGVLDAKNTQSQQDDNFNTNNKSDENMLFESSTQVSTGSKETASTTGTGTDGSGNDNHHQDESQSMVSDAETETSSVAHLRHWLDDFGQQNKKHFETAASIGSAPPDAKKVIRSRVQKSTTLELPPSTPATHMIKSRKVDTVPHPRARATPVRIKTRRHSDVEATNDGYKSVAKLSAWLADDPTKSKSQVTSIRRGANVIAKSRAFDKGLANVIIEENSIRNGNVQLERRRLEAECDESTTGSKLETASSISVSQQKQWLANAFKKEESVVERAKTELVTDREKTEDATLRAKKMWRQRSGTNLVEKKEQPMDASSKAKEMWRERSAAEKRLPHMSPERKSTRSKQCPSSGSRKAEVPEQPSSAVETEEEQLGFREARKLLVQRSKKNGHNVEVLTKVGMKKAKFERIERENTRRRSSSQGLLKAHWGEGDNEKGHSSTAYVKSFLENPKPKKTFDELP